MSHPDSLSISEKNDSVFISEKNDMSPLDTDSMSEKNNLLPPSSVYSPEMTNSEVKTQPEVILDLPTSTISTGIDSIAVPCSAGTKNYETVLCD